MTTYNIIGIFWFRKSAGMLINP